MPVEATNLLLLDDLEEGGGTSDLAESDLEALHAVAEWITTFVVKPHKDLGRAGTVCPFVPGSLERKTLWLVPEQIADRDVPEVVELMSDYKRLLLDTRPTEGDDAIYNVIVIVFSDLPADRAQGVFDDVLRDLAVSSYVEDGILFGPYYEGNKAPAIYNASFRPFQSPAPFLFVRHGVTSDWKFFLDDEEWLNFVGASPWGVRSPSPCSGTTPLAVARRRPRELRRHGRVPWLVDRPRHCLLDFHPDRLRDGRVRCVAPVALGRDLYCRTRARVCLRSLGLEERSSQETLARYGRELTVRKRRSSVSGPGALDCEPLSGSDREEFENGVHIGAGEQ